MPLKLLQHKSWHVYSAENIARVQRDEAAAAARAEGDEERAQAAEAEARVERMRKKARKRGSEGDDDGEREMERQLKGRKRDERDREQGKEVRAEMVRPDKGKEKEKDPGSMMTNGHLNFWAELEAGNAAPASTSAVAARLKREKEKELEDSATKVFMAKRGEGEPRGWYADEEGRTEKERSEGDEERLERTYKDTALKRLTDPLALMNQYLARRDAVLTSASLPSARQPSSRDRYITPSSSASAYSATPHSTRGTELAPIEPKLLPPSRRRGDPLPPTLSPPRRSISSSAPHAAAPSDPHTEAATRVSSERARAAALLASRRKAALSSSASSVASTPARSEAGGWGMYNRDDVRAAREAREGGGGKEEGRMEGEDGEH
ncbi:hypothetical protein JCM10213v2_007513 [Rhodosporidiobolus nylandii]